MVGVPDRLYGEAGYGFVQLEPGAGVEPAALAAFCRERLANYKIPKQIHVIEALPLLPLGKVDKRTLRERVQRTLETAR